MSILFSLDRRAYLKYCLDDLSHLPITGGNRIKFAFENSASFCKAKNCSLLLQKRITSTFELKSVQRSLLTMEKCFPVPEA